MAHPSPSAANESTLQQQVMSRSVPDALIEQTTTVNPRPGAGGTTTSGLVISVGVSHTWHYGSPTATVAVQIPTGVNETPTVAVQIRNKPKRRRRKRPDKAARRARLAAGRTNSLDPTPAAVKTEDTDENIKRAAP
ncbi:hypothetical protein IFM58399_08292 [Aspergillus lentulus]|uniref:Uncharacterized protein n=1 Tax=Aspergillus lentulus TaxID=293939 RepID=A0ABQ1AJ66_ASPLE|nr:uncharacterized protein IFM58399_08292 [Aspergillus lentulus]KAF4169704.1 hypothetical protein CNMCM6936_006863 [Aspergillus lentulus]GFF48405.1 hypothetical protein IFM58399_08292 [Aspergillus lentulus]GFF66531.1 hypothetical protein IFM62136_06652 [Aspergillus lentulus]GFF82910.1 hypothetical protein IFM60648_06513 [Aspergillus lentulus]GFF86739.1 hypothetical protein IFM47457_07262 [Aspergillus lentulus]